MTGYDFYTGRPIVPPRMKSLDPQLQYRPSTNNLWKEIGEELNVSPLYIENLWRGYTGTIGMWVANSTDSATRELFGMPDRQAFRFDELPAVGSLLIPSEGRGLENEFYLLKESTDLLLSSIKDAEDKILDRDRFAFNLSNEYKFEYMGVLESLTEDLNNIDDLISQTRDEETRILNSTDLDPDEKAKALQEQQATRNFILRGMGDKRVELEEGLFETIRANQ
jgi:hypothetical protein